MALCWECWRTFSSDDVNQHLCEHCRCQRKLYMYMEDIERECPPGAEVQE